MIKLFCLIGAISSILLPGTAHAIVHLRVQQVGPSVVISGSGSANTTALTPAGSDGSWTNLLSDAQAYAGPGAFSDGNVSLWGGLLGPLVVGNDPSVFEIPASGSGDLFGILANDGTNISLLVLPDGYLSGSSLSGSSIFSGANLSQLGLLPGQISTWSWGSGATADSLRLEVLAPEPTTVPGPLPLAGAAAAFHRCRRLRRLHQQVLS
jgi:hypothetical protein